MHRWLPILVMMAFVPAGIAQESPVYVDHSPRAWELFRRALDQQNDNPGETVRLFQELLDEYPLQLAPVSEIAPDHLTTFRHRIHQELVANQELLERYQTIATPQAQRLLDVGDLPRLVRSRALTQPGLDGLLQLAQDALEDGRFHVASSYLVEASAHPTRTAAHAAHCWSMTATAACFLDDEAGVDHARLMLVGLGEIATPFIETLDELLSVRRRPRSTRGTSTLDTGTHATLNDLVAEAIWSLDLEQGSLVTRTMPTSTDLNVTPGRRQTADRLATTVTVADDRAYVNDGHTLICLDRFTGNRIWLRPFTDRLLRTRGSAESRPRDLNVVSVSGDWLVTLSGHAEEKDRSGDGRIVCLDATTGDTRWTRVLDGIGLIEDHEGLFPYGTPLITDRTVYLLGRKVSDQSLTSCYVVAIELTTGELRWARHIASSGAIRRTSRPFSTLVHDRGQLFVATNVGAVCCLDAATGRTEWLRRYQVPIHFADQDVRGCELPGPVVTPTGVLALQQDGRRMRLIVFDRETGDELESYDAGTLDGWAAPRYLLANEHYVYAVGTEVRAFRLENLARPIWELPSRRLQSGTDGVRRTTPEPLRIVGRVQLTEEALVVPSRAGIRMLDPSTGVEMHRLPINGVGNPLAIDSQLFMASTEHLDAYMSYTNAERMLRRRIGEHPDDPDVALSLLRLGMRVENLDLVLEASELVLSAASATRSLDVSEIARRTLLELLLQVAEQRLASTREDGELLYAMLGAAASTPDQRVRFQLAYGDWLEEASLDRAVECYQTILSDPALASAEYLTGSTVRSARDLAIDRLGAIIGRHGPDVYAPQADFALMEFETLAERTTDSAEPLIELIREFPFAPSSIDAALLATDRAIETGDHRAAVQALAVASQQVAEPEAASRLLSRLVAICDEYRWNRAAHAIVARVARRLPTFALTVDGGSVLATEWLARPDDEQAQVDRPRIGVSPDRERTRKLTGPLLIPVTGAPTPPTDRLLTIDDTRLTLHDTSLDAVWTVEIDGEEPQLLRFTDRDILLWFGKDLRDPRAVMLNTSDGTHRWTTPELSEHLDDSAQQLAQLRDQNQTMPNGRVFDPRETLALVHGESLIIAQRTGGVVAFDLLDGEARWAAQRTIDQIHAIATHDFGLALAGARLKRDALAGRTEAIPVVLVLDLEQDGAVRWRIHPHANDAVTGAGVRWIVTTDTGSLVYGTDDGIEAFDLLAGGRQWSSLGPTATGAEHGWAMSDVVVIEDRTRQLRTVATEDGTVSRPFDTSTIGGDWDPQDLRALHIDDRDQALALFRQRLVRYHRDGTVLGADAIIDVRLYQHLIPVRDMLVLVSMFKREQVVSEDGHAETERTYRVYTLAPSGKLLDVVPMAIPRKPVRHAAVIDGWILLSTAFNTYAVSMPDPD